MNSNISVYNKKDKDKLKTTTPVQRKRMQEIIVEQISDWIMDGTLQSGERLLECDLAERFGVSRIPVREALQTLQAKGLVQNSPFIGMSVKKYSVDELREIYQLRRLMETYALEHAVKMITEDEISELEQMCDVLEKRMDLHEDESVETIKWYFYHNHDFHMKIYQATHMTKLVQIITDLWDSIACFRIKNVRKPGYAKQMLEEHRFYVDCLKMRNVKALTESYSQNLEFHVNYFIDNDAL